MRLFKNPVLLAQRIIAEILRPGDRAIDATAGNGNDTLFLAGIVGSTGEVFAFDTQPQAIHRTAQRLKEAAAPAKVYLVNAGHENMLNYVSGQFQAIMFNLGYLPGTGQQFATQPESTVLALQQAVKLLAPAGIITVVVYVGHEGATAEQQAVEEWAQSLPQKEWDLLRCDYPNRANDPPYLIVIQRVEETVV